MDTVNVLALQSKFTVSYYQKQSGHEVLTWISRLNSFSRATKSLRDLGSWGYQGSASDSSGSLLFLSEVISPSFSAVGQAHSPCSYA